MASLFFIPVYTWNIIRWESWHISHSKMLQVYIIHYLSLYSYRFFIFQLRVYLLVPYTFWNYAYSYFILMLILTCLWTTLWIIPIPLAESLAITLAVKYEPTTSRWSAAISLLMDCEIYEFLGWQSSNHVNI